MLLTKHWQRSPLSNGWRIFLGTEHTQYKILFPENVSEYLLSVVVMHADKDKQAQNVNNTEVKTGLSKLSANEYHVLDCNLTVHGDFLCKIIS